MTKLIIIAGPQSSGKTTLLEYLKKKYSQWLFIDEVNPRSVTGKKNFGAANTNADLEKKIIEKDIENIKNIDRNKKIVVLECGIFHYVYARYFIYKKQADYYYKKYLEAHTGLDPFVIFIKTTPDVSWRRRKEKYLRRIKNKGITDEKITEEYLSQYRKIINDLYPLWLKCYKKIPFKKITIENSNKGKKEFLEEPEKIIRTKLFHL